MSERAGLNKRFSHHFILDESKLRKIVDTIRTSALKTSIKTKITFHISTEDKAFFSTVDINRLLDYENPKGKEIDTLHIELRSEIDNEDTELLAHFALSRSREDKITISITGPDRDWCFILGEELETQAKRTHTYKDRPWLQSGLADVLLGISIVAMAMLALAILNPTQALGDTSDISKILTSTLEQKVNWLIEQQARKSKLALSLAPIAAIFPLMILVQTKPIAALSRLLQRSTFYWGDAKNRHDTHIELMKNVKWVVIIGFVISVVAGLFTTAIQLKLFP